MTINKTLLPLLVASSSLMACSGSQEVPKTVYQLEQEWLDLNDGKEGDSQPLNSTQVTLANIALQEAVEIANDTQDQEALTLVEYAGQAAVPAVLTSTGPIPLDDSQLTLEKDDFLILGISKDDVGIHPISDFFIQNPANGVFNEDIQTLFLYADDALQEKWLGIITLHEISHAYQRAQGEASLTSDESVNEEARVRVFQHRIAREIFGEPYRYAVEEFKNNVREDFFASMQDPNTSFILPDIDVSEFVAKQATQKEIRFATSTVLFDGLFSLLDEFGKSSLSDKQALFDNLAQQLA